MKWINQILRITIWIGGLFLLISVGISVYIYNRKDAIINAAIRQLNEHLIVPIDVHKVEVSFRHFPRISVVFTDVRCTESAIRDPELLLNTEKVSVRFSLADVLFSRYFINEIGIDNGYMHIKIFEDGTNNFSIVKTDTSSVSSPFEIERLHLKNIQITYSDFKEKIFTSQMVFNSVLSANYLDFIQIKAQWNAQNIYFKMQDWSVEEPLNHSAIAFLQLSKDSLKLQLNKAYIDDINLDLNYYIENSDHEFRLQIKNQPILSKPLVQNLLKDKALNYQLKKDVISTTITGTYSGDKWSFVCDFNAHGKHLVIGKESIQIDELKFTGEAIVNTKGISVSITDLMGQSTGVKIAGNVQINHQKNTIISGSFSMNGEPIGIARLIDAESLLKGKGHIHASGTFGYTLLEGSKQKNSSIPVQFDCTLSSDNLELAFGQNTVMIPSLSLQIDNRGFAFRQKLTVNDRVVDADLQIGGFASWIVDSSALLDVGGQLYIQKYDEFFWRSESNLNESPLAVLNRLRINLNLLIDEYVAEQLKCKDIQAVIIKSGNDIEIKSLEMNLFGGSLDFAGILNATSAGWIMKGKAHLRKIDLSQLMLGFNDFQQNSLTHKNLFGRLSGVVHFSLPLSYELEPDFKMLNANMDVRVSDGRLINFEPIEALGRFADIDELKDIRFEELINKLNIENQMIRIPQFEIRSNALNLILEGTHSFENTIEYKVGLSLSDVLYQKRKRNRSVNDFVFEEDDNGARIWIRISGTTDQPRITPIKAELVRSRNQLLTKTKEIQADTVPPPSKPSKSPFKYEWDEN